MDVDLSAQLRPRKRQAAGAALQSNSQQGRPGSMPGQLATSHLRAEAPCATVVPWLRNINLLSTALQGRGNCRDRAAAQCERHHTMLHSNWCSGMTWLCCSRRRERGGQRGGRAADPVQARAAAAGGRRLREPPPNAGRVAPVGAVREVLQKGTFLSCDFLFGGVLCPHGLRGPICTCLHDDGDKLGAMARANKLWRCALLLSRFPGKALCVWWAKPACEHCKR